MPTTLEKCSVSPFTVEIDHPRNCDVSIKSIPGHPLRGAIKSSVTIIPNQKKSLGGIDEEEAFRSAHQLSVPRIPGQHIHLQPEKRTYLISDPLFEDEALCERIAKALRQSDKCPFFVGEIRGMPPQSGELGKDEFKTLVREICLIVASGEARVVKGSLPSRESVDALPGDYLLNPGVRVPYSQPRYEKDLESWVEQLSRTGG